MNSQNRKSIIIGEPPEEIIEEPVIDLIRRINSIPGNVILTGVPKCGKATVLKKLFKQGPSSNINYYFDDVIAYLIQKTYTKEELIDMLERKTLKYFSERILSAEEQDEVLELIRIKYGNITDRYINFGEISNIIINYFLYLGKQVHFIIDNFEDVKTLLKQKSLIDYGKLFQKSIISVEEEILKGHEETFNKHGYEIVKCEYSSNPLFIKLYIDRVFLILARSFGSNNLADQLPENYRYSDIVGNEILEIITREANGDLVLVSKILKEIIDKSIEKGFLNSVDDQILVKDTINYMVGRDREVKKYYLDRPGIKIYDDMFS